MKDPRFLPGARVIHRNMDAPKTVVSSYIYKGGPDWGYVLLDDGGVEDDGWREDELQEVE